MIVHRRIATRLGLGALLLVMGCSTVARRAPNYGASVDASGTSSALRVAPSESTAPLADASGPGLSLPRTDVAGKPVDETPTGPEIGSPIVVPSSLELDVEAPPRKQLGSAVEFRLRIRNTSSETVDDVAIECDFDEGFVFSDRPEKRVRQSLGSLAAQATRELPLTLVSRSEGTLCARFTVFAGEQEIVWKSVCVEIVPRVAQLEIVAPGSREAGSTAEVVVKLTSLAQEDLTDVRLTLEYDAVFQPREVSRGAAQNGRRLEWSLGTLRHGEQIRLSAEFLCRDVSEAACLRVAVSGRNLPADETEVCLKIQRRQGPLGLRIDDTADPIRVGESTEFVVSVHNRALEDVADVTLTIHLPEALEFTSATLSEAGKPLNQAPRVEGRLVVVGPLPALAPDSHLECRVRVKAVATGNVGVRASVDSAVHDEPLYADEPLVIDR